MSRLISLLTLITTFGSFTSIFSQSISRETAISMVKTQIIGIDSIDFNIYMKPGAYTDDFCITRVGDSVENPYSFSWLFFVDEMPAYNWGHPCSYIFIDTTNGNYQRIAESFFPFGYKDEMDEISISYSDTIIEIIPPGAPIVSSITNDPHKYALIFSGDITSLRWNDLSHMYSALKRNGFSDENIFVFKPSYTIWELNLDHDDEHLNDFDGDCTFENIENTMNSLKSTLDEDDIFFFYCSTHGMLREDTVNASYLVLQNEEQGLDDFELDTMLQGMVCSEIIIVIDACYSGGFVEELEGNHRTVQTCTDGEHFMSINGLLGYNFLTYAYATALKGYHPIIGEPWSVDYNSPIGSQDLSELCDSCWKDTEDVNPDIEIGGNIDGYIQTGEAFNYAAYLCGQIENEGVNYQNHGFIGDLLTLNGIEGRVDSSQEITGNFLIGRKLTIAPDVVLTGFSNSQHPLNLFLNDSTEILVQDSATLDVNWYYTKYIGCSGQSFVNIEGDISSNYMNFEANTGATININFNNTSKNYTLTAFNFENASIHASCNQLKFSLTDFENSPLEFSGGRLELSQSNLLSGSDLEFSGAYLKITYNNVIDNSDLFLNSGTDTIDWSNDIISAEIEFSGDELYIFGPNNISNCALNLTNGNINIEDNNSFTNSSIAMNDPLDEASFIEISDNSFDNDSIIDANAVVTIENYLNFLVDHNDFSYASGRGIELFYAGWDGRGTQSIEDNTIQFTGTAYPQIAELGIHSYYSTVQITNNQITDNDYGIAGFHGSHLIVIGNSQATSVDSTQLIADNTISQCVFNYSSFPTAFEYNVIRDYTSGTNPFIQAVEYDEMIIDTNQNREIRGILEFVVENNCWVDHSDPSGRLIPLGYYDWDPVWCPGENYLKSDDVAETMFYEAKAEIVAENYQAADSGFKQIIAGFPDNRFALASLKELFALNPALHDSNYATLKAYCDKVSLNPGDSLLGKTAEWISIHCNIRDQHYQQAINSLDSIITNPGTQADSVFALIDLAYVFTQNNSDTAMKSVLVTKHPEIVPESNYQFNKRRKEWIDNLLQPKGGSSLGVNEMIDPPGEFPTCRITSIRPNPSQGDFTVDLDVRKAGEIRLLLVSPTGAVIAEYTHFAENPGKYYKTISDLNLKPGIYYLLGSVEQDKPDAKKLIIFN